MTTKTALLTIPDALDHAEPYAVTGNEFVALATISPRDAGVRGMNVLSMRARGLVEFRGEPLLAPRLELDGRAASLHDRLTWTWLDAWLPQFQWTDASGNLTGTLFAPPGYRGWVYALEFENGAQAQNIRLGLDLDWRETALTIFSTRVLEDVRHAAWDRWTRSFVCESSSAACMAAFAIGAEGEVEVRGQGRIEIGHAFQLEPGERANLAFLIAVGAERDAARTTVVDLRRHGAVNLLAQTRAWLGAHRGIAGPSQSASNRAALQNQLFAYFFSLGTTIDTEELALVTSRSPLYYVSAATWPRDALLWSFPAILALDPPRAREVLQVAFQRHLKHPGEHAQYIDGALLYPGFELDQLCAFPLALARYWRATGDDTILADPAIARGLDTVLDVLMSKKHPEVDLFSTFLLSTDDPAPLPYVTYSNALASVALRATGEMARGRARGLRLRWPPSKCVRLAERVRLAIYKHCTVPLDEDRGARMFAGAVDLKGHHLLFDEPPGSLVVLPHYGFCGADDPVYRHTVEWVNSRANPYYFEHAGVPMPACIHAPYPWPMSLVNQILADPNSRAAKDARECLAGLALDGGLACESVDAATGVVKTGRMMASFAGWLGYALGEAAARSALAPNDKMGKSKRTQAR